MELNTNTRTIKGKRVKHLRSEGLTPLGLYGKGVTRDLETEKKEFEDVFRKGGESTLINLKIDGKDYKKVLIDEVQHHPVTGNIIHATLRQVDLTKKTKANVGIAITGEPEIVKSGAGLLIQLIDELEIECLPTDLLSEIKVDATKLIEIGDTILIKDLDLDRNKLSIDLEDDEPVAKIDYPQMEEKEEEKEEEISEADAIAQVEASEEKEEKDDEKEEKGKGTTEPKKDQEKVDKEASST